MRQGAVLIQGLRAGTITENETGYQFIYDEDYLSLPSAEPVSLTLPLRKEPYEVTTQVAPKGRVFKIEYKSAIVSEVPNRLLISVS